MLYLFCTQIHTNMDTKVKKKRELDWKQDLDESFIGYNPDALDHTRKLRVKAIELTDDYTRIDFIYRSPDYYVNGGWIEMDPLTYISPVGSGRKYQLMKAINIPLAPMKHYFKRSGELHTYSLIFPALQKSTRQIDIIEKLAPGNYFNFFNVNFSSWMKVVHPLDVQYSNN